MILETDSLSVMQLLTGGNEQDSGHYNVLIGKCKDFLQRNWSVEVTRVHREANFAVDGIANWALHGRPLGKAAKAVALGPKAREPLNIDRLKNDNTSLCSPVVWDPLHILMSFFHHNNFFTILLSLFYLG